MGNVVHFMSRNDIQARPLQVVLDHGARGRGRFDGMMNVSSTISRSYRAGGRLPICSRATRRGGSPLTSSSCRTFAQAIDRLGFRCRRRYVGRMR